MEDSSRKDVPAQDASAERSFEDELRAAYEELEAARRRLDEIKAKHSADGREDAANASQAPPPAEPESASGAAVRPDGAAFGAPAEAGGTTGFGGEAQASSQAAAGPAGPQGAYRPYEPGSQSAPPQDAWRQPQQPAGQASSAGWADAAQQAWQQGAQRPGAGQQTWQQGAGQWTDSAQQTWRQPAGQQASQQQWANQQQAWQGSWQQPYYRQQVVRTKDHVAAGLLGIFLGVFGIHKFYLGYNTAGFIMLAVTIVGSLFTLGLAAGVMTLIGIIEGVIYLVKSQTDFEQLYVYGKREWF